MENGATGGLERYIPRLLMSRLPTDPPRRLELLEGTFVFIDVSGFTKLSERLAKVGKEGAELLVDAINSCFTALLADVHLLGGSLVKFGGDALLLWFEGDAHAVRGCDAAVLMRRRLREVGRITIGSSTVTLRMSVGVHSGEFHSFLVGGLFHDLIIAGPGASKVVELEGAAEASQILISEATAAQIPPRCVGERTGPGFLLARASGAAAAGEELVGELPALDPALLAMCLPPQVRHQVESSPGSAEHRTATVAFLEFGRFDEMLERDGPDPTCGHLQELVAYAQATADEQQICLIDSDVSGGSGKLRFTAGAPRVVGDDEERMLLAMRKLLAADTPFPIRIGVNRGPVFTGEIGPPYRRTYVCMGDTVNLAARLMGKARPGTIFATGGVLERSHTKFDLEQLDPFKVKGKKNPIRAWSVGPPLRAVPSRSASVHAPLIGRDDELEVLRRAVSAASHGAGSLVEIVGDVGSGKSRLLTEVREIATDMRFVHSTCEPYTRGIPYVAWRDPLRQLLGLSWEDAPATVLERLRAELSVSRPELLQWLPLLSIAAGGEPINTPEVEALSPEAHTRVLHEAVLAFLGPALALPTLVNIEHAHLMDAASAALLVALCDALPSAPWIVMVTRRESAEGFVAPDHDAVTRLELGLLSREETLRLAESTPAAHVVPPHILELAVDRSGGNPEFLMDLLAAAQAGAGQLPESVDAAAMARIDQLDPGDRTLIRRASVLGVSFHPERVRDVLPENTPAPTVETWSRLSSVFALDPDGHVRFKRPVLCEVAYEGLPFRERRVLHAAVGAALERNAGHDADAEPAVLSLHFFFAADWDRAWRYALRGAERAAQRYAHADASLLYRRALEAGRHRGVSSTELAACWEALGDALQRTGELGAAATAFNMARGLSAGDPHAQARLLHKRMVVAHIGGELTASVRRGSAAMRALEHAPNRDAQALRAQLLVELAFVRWRQGRFALSERLCRAAIEQAEHSGVERALAQASYVLDFVLLDLDRAEEATYSPRALEIYERLGDREQQGNVLNTMAVLASFRWDWDEAVRLYGRAEDCYAQAGELGGVATAASNLGEILSDRGLVDEAAVRLEHALRVADAMGERTLAANTKALLGRTAARSGNVESARQWLTEASAELSSLGEAHYLEFADSALAETEAFAGDPALALKIVARLFDLDRRGVAWLHRIRGAALARLGQMQDAVVALETSLALARSQDALYDVVATLDALQEVGTGGDPAERDLLQRRLGIERFHALDLRAEQAPVLTGA